MDIIKIDSLSDSINLYEVSMRDGLQSVENIINTDDKLFILKNLIDSGFKDIEVTSFSNPKKIPQFYDAEELCLKMPNVDGVRLWALAPNEIGYKRAMSVGVKNISTVISASESHNMKNLGSSLEDKLSEIKKIISYASNDGVTVRTYISTCFECPYEGEISPKLVSQISEELIGAGASCVAISDTIGCATTDDVEIVLSSILSRNIPLEKISLHMHDSGGSSVDNILKGIEMGVSTFDTALGGIGGCPYSNGRDATNAETESICKVMLGLGIDTGIKKRLFDIVSFLRREK